MDELIKMLRSKEAKAFGIFITIGIVVVTGSIVWNKYLTNKVLWQQSQINKYVLREHKSKYSKEQQADIEKTEFQ